MVNYQCFDGDVPRAPSYGVYISYLIQFAGVSCQLSDFNARNQTLTVRLLQQAYQYHKLRKVFAKFNPRNYELI